MNASTTRVLNGLHQRMEPVALVNEGGDIVWANSAVDVWFGVEAPASVAALLPEIRWSHVLHTACSYGVWRWATELRGDPEPRPVEVTVRRVDRGYVLRARDASGNRDKELLLRSCAQALEGHQRTIDRREAKLRSLLDTMQHAVFCVDRTARIVAPVSRFTRQMLGEEVEQRRVMETLFRGVTQGSESYARIETALSAMLGADDNQWARSRDALPSHVVLSAHPSTDARAVRVRYSPVWDDHGLLDRIVCVVEDESVREQQREVVTTAWRDSAQELEMLHQLANIPRRARAPLVRTSLARLQEVHAQLAAGVVSARTLSVLHQVNAEARRDGLKVLARAVEVAETAVRAHRGGGADRPDAAVMAPLADAIECARAYLTLVNRVFGLDIVPRRAAA